MIAVGKTGEEVGLVALVARAKAVRTSTFAANACHHDKGVPRCSRIIPVFQADNHLCVRVSFVSHHAVDSCILSSVGPLTSTLMATNMHMFILDASKFMYLVPLTFDANHWQLMAISNH